MLRSKKFIIPVVLVIVLLAGSLGGVVLAQTTGSSGNSGKTLMARVAAILGIDESTLQSAFKQAQTDMQVEQLDAQLSKLVSDGTITQEQADAYETWYSARPDDSDYQQALREWQNSKPSMPEGFDLRLPGIDGPSGPGMGPPGGMGRRGGPGGLPGMGPPSGMGPGPFNPPSN